MDQYEWNKILIFADGTISNHKQIRLFVNFGEESINLDPGDDELTLVLETKGICRFDDCGNPLSVTVNGKKQYVFSITKIDPVLDDS